METIHNCTCLPKTFAQGKEYEGCVYGSAQKTINKDCPIAHNRKDLKKTCDSSDRTKWCQIKEKNCGFYDTNNTRWDYCEYPLDLITKGNTSDDVPLLLNKRHYVLGTMIYLLIFGIFLPYYFMRKGWIELIEVWITNLDLLATCLGFRNGLFNTKLFSYLYRLDNEGGPVAYWSTLVINYAALLGVCMVVAHRVYRTKSITHGWCVAMVMLIVTYLVPNEIIKSVIEKTSLKLEDYFIKKGVKFTERINRLLTIIPILVGIAVALGFIMIEKFILRTQIDNLDRLAKFILKPLKLETQRVMGEEKYRKKRKK